MEIDIGEIFPYSEYRPYQKEVLEKSFKALVEEDKDLVMIEAPVGFGKSACNVTIGKHFGNAFYTTPQVKLVRQLEEFCPDELAIDGGTGDIMSLMGRKNYTCRESGERSDKCMYRKGKLPCSKRENCTYYRQKTACMDADVCIMTFAMMIGDSFLKQKRPQSTFNNRDLLVVDECHSIEEDTASMFAGFKISPDTLPEKVWNNVYMDVPDSENIADHIDFIKDVKSECEDFLDRLNIDPEDKDKARVMLRNIEYFLNEMDKNRAWEVDMSDVRNWEKLTKRNVRRPLYTPIKVDRFLKKILWSRADKYVLSTARFPYRGHPKRWLRRIGLYDVDFEFISVPMTFPVENRPIVTRYTGGEMTNHKEEENWDTNVRTVNNIIQHHKGEKGVVHTQSYERASKLNEDLEHDAYVHSRDENDVIENWIQTEEDVLLSPAIKEGVDLVGDLCRFQVLFKVPYPNMGDSRVSHIVNKLDDWEWYYDKTAEDITQAYGRAVRHSEDEAKFYIVDGSFKKVRKRADFPEWFKEALGRV